jgi:glycine/D-amino acid oxidase-like deaminating enzyme/nitrite reductase/ring-hydroxylating ferredoxin subunit
MYSIDQNSIKRDGANSSLWQLEAPTLATQPAKTYLYDVIIIGGGITGLTTAIDLQRAGKSCLLVEAHNLGFGTTGGTSAHLNTFLDATYPEVDSDFGKDVSKLLASTSARMITKIKNNIDEFGIAADFEYRDGYLFSQSEKETKQLEEIYIASKEAGVDVSKADTNGLPIEFEASYKFGGQAQFHPIKYIYGLAKAFLERGGIIKENTMITNAVVQDDVHHVKFDTGEFTARNIVWATHVPPGINILSLRNAPYRSYVLGIRLKDEAYPDCLSYDMQEPYHYFRSHVIEGKQYLVLGGADHKTGHDDPGVAFADLEQYAKENFKVASIDYRWSSQYFVPVDGLPYIGHMPGAAKGIYVSTGFNGNGMIFGSLTGEILTNLITGREDRLADILSPSRLKPVSGFTEFIKENADVAYRFVADRFGADLIKSLSELPAGEGKVVKYEDEKLAIYKDEQGRITALSPVCTHAGCIVNWNGTEKSWDCPCHGGRFAVDGTVLTGPPREALKCYKR